MLVSSFDSGIYPRCKWGITDIDGTAYGDWTPGSGPYYAATEKEKQQLYDTMPIEVKNWLKSIKPQSKAEWSEEDSDIVEELYEYFRYLQLTSDKEFSPSLSIDKILNWLKSLRPQYHGDVTMTEAYKMGKEAGEASHWKPSEGQMEALNVLNLYGELSYVGQQNQLISLYQDLKKL